MPKDQGPSWMRGVVLLENNKIAWEGMLGFVVKALTTGVSESLSWEIPWSGPDQNPSWSVFSI